MNNDYLRQRVLDKWKGIHQPPQNDFKPPSLDEQINDMPNWEKITPFERGIYKALPGFSQSTFGKALASFSEGWAGKALSYLDIPAEGLERSFGLMIQLANGGIRKDELKAAWYAGSLTAETARLPGLKYDKDGKIIGVHIMEDLPDVAGLIDARKQIQDLMANGSSAADALIKVRDNYYNSLGALGLRAQLQDTFIHTVLDPLNYILPALKPVERLKVKSLTALGKKIAVSEEEAATFSTRITEQISKLTQAGDVKEAAKWQTDLDIFTATMEQVRKGELPKITQGDRIAIMLTGGDPFRPNKAIQKIADIPVLGWPVKAFQLTPESKVKGLLSMMSDNIGTTMINRFAFEADGEREFTKALGRISNGATGIEFGPAILSPEGRTAQGFYRGSYVKVKALFEKYDLIKDDRAFLQMVSEALGDPADAEKWITKAGSDPDGLIRMLQAKKGVNPVLDAMIDGGQLTPERIATLTNLKDAPYSKDMFFAQAMDLIEEHAAHQAVVQFGVEARGLGTRWASAIKAGESLAFLRLNPAYPIRNWINNETTMLARGMFGLITPKEEKALMEGIAWAPSRMKESFTTELGGLAKQSDRYRAMEVLEKALQGGHYGAPEKIQEAFRQVSLGKIDAAAFGRRLEEAASNRATLHGFKQYFNRWWKPKSVATYMDQATLDAVKAIDPDFVTHFDNSVRGSHAVVEQLRQALGGNMTVNVNSVLDEAGRAANIDIREALGTELLTHIHDGLPKAIAEGKVDDFVNLTRTKIDAHIQDLFDKQIGNVIEHVKTQAQVGGPQVFYKYMGEAQDMFWSAHAEHAYRSPEAIRLAREAAGAKDYARAHELWNRIAEDDAKFFDRAFKRVDAYLAGMEQAGSEGVEIGGKVVKFPVPSEVRRSFGEWKQTWADFFQYKNTERNAFFEAVKNKQTPAKTWDQLTTEFEANYKLAAKREDDLMRVIDDHVAGMIEDPDMKNAFVNARDMMANLRATDKEGLVEIMRQVREAEPNAREGIWKGYWKQRAETYLQMKEVDTATRNIMQGDPEALQMFSKAAPTRASTSQVNALTKKYGVHPKEALNVVNKFLRGEYTGEKIDQAASKSEDLTRLMLEFQGDPRAEAMLKKMPKAPQGAIQSLREADVNTIRDAFRARLLAGHGKIPPGMTMEDFLSVVEDVQKTPITAARKLPQQFMADFIKVVPDPMPMDLGQDLMTYGRSYGALDQVAAAAKSQARKVPSRVANLPPDLQEKVMKAVTRIEGDLSGDRYVATRFAEWRRDAALLNYNRRTNFDAFAGNIFPYIFWTTGSIQKWAVESIDRPAMFTTYLRMKKMLATSGLGNQEGQPSRVRGSIRIPLPFKPDWMGDSFVDPLRVALPFDSMMSPIDQMQKQQQGVEGRAERLLENKVSSGEIDQADFQEAIANHTGPLWDEAMAETQRNDEGDKFDAWDFATAMSSPHAPLMWAYNAAAGHPEDIAPFAPASRIMRNAATLLGVDDWQNSSWNIEGKIRHKLGLPAFDKWDDYRIDRAISDLAGRHEYAMDDIKEAMYISAAVQAGKMTPEEAKKNEIYAEGVKRANQEYTGGVSGFILGTLGLSTKSVPEGEANLRRLQDDFGQAYEKKNAAETSLDAYLKDHADVPEEEASKQWEKLNPKLARDADALNKFFDDHPEYETRLALWKKPEERLQTFLVNQLWTTYNNFPSLNKREIRDQLGPEFERMFLNRDTRATDQISPELASVWLKLMGAEPPGTLQASEKALLSLNALKLTKPETAWRVQQFYDIRNGTYEDYYSLQNGYFALSTRADRAKYLKANPALVEYWDWRRDWLMKNPDLAPYLEDDPKKLERIQKYGQRGPGSVPTQAELPPEVHELVTAFQGQPFPPALEAELYRIAAQYGISLEQLLGMSGYTR